MSADLSTALPLILLGLVMLVVGLWMVSRSLRKAKVIRDDSAAPLARDVLAEGAERAPRNQALIDAAPAVAAPAPQPEAPAPEPMAEAPAPAPAPAPVPASADDLSRIKGIGPKLVALLGELGVTSFAQIAAWSEADVTRIDAQLGRFAGRITRDQWIEQAKLLATGDEAGFTDKFGKNG
jgi:predicted flap endonuclease-1-like 5' DNA nuclease